MKRKRVSAHTSKQTTSRTVHVSEYIAILREHKWIALVPFTLILLLPGLYAMFSVKRYFGFARAAGGDHFDRSYRDLPLVRKGIFRYTSNGMYVYAFLLFWAIAVGFNSLAAVVVAAFSHAYIWVHFHATEKPDMEYLYGS